VCCAESRSFAAKTFQTIESDRERALSRARTRERSVCAGTVWVSSLVPVVPAEEVSALRSGMRRTLQIQPAKYKAMVDNDLQ
jgi:hypothetical protein